MTCGCTPRLSVRGTLEAELRRPPPRQRKRTARKCFSRDGSHELRSVAEHDFGYVAISVRPMPAETDYKGSLNHSSHVQLQTRLVDAPDVSGVVPGN